MLVNVTVVVGCLLWPAAMPTRDADEPVRIANTQPRMGVPTGRTGSVSQAGHSGTAEQVAEIGRKIAATSTYDDIVFGARRCSAQDACAIAGGVRGCRCPVAVRASTKQAVDAAAAAASCEQVERLYCPPLRNPRCEREACIADEVPE
jgi:hypothetical protein